MIIFTFPVFLFVAHSVGQSHSGSPSWRTPPSLSKWVAVSVASAFLSLVLIFTTNWTTCVVLYSLAGLLVAARSAQSPQLVKVCFFFQIAASLGVLGFMPLLGASVNLFDGTNTEACVGYFTWKKVSTLSLCKENGWLGFVRFMTALVVVIQPFCILFASSSYASATGDEPEAAPGEDRRKSTTGSVSNAGAPAPSAPVPGLVDHATLSGVPSNFSGYQSMQ